MRKVAFAGALSFALVSFAAPCVAQQPSAPVVQPVASHADHADHADHGAHVSGEEIAAFARVAVAVGAARDSTQKQLAQPRNKTNQMQAALRAQLAAQIADILKKADMSEAEFRQKTYLVSADSAARAAYDETVAKLTGAPLPGQAADASAPVKVPVGALGTQLANIVNAFNDTPKGQGLLPMAIAEARVAALHASLGARDLTNLDNMKLHAGHVINAVDPTVMPQGPGAGYGVKRAALGVATYVGIAAKTPGAPAAVATHAQHVGDAARNTVQRTDDVVALAKKIQGASTAADAAPLMTQLVALTGELVLGKGASGGLAQCDEHMKLLLAAAQ